MALKTITPRILHFFFFVLFLWMVSIFGLDSEIEDAKIKCIDRERRALLSFKHGLIDEFEMLSSWGTEEDKKDCCKWSGVKCSNTTGHVVVLDIPNYSLEGKISSSLLELQHLYHLDLGGNFFISSIPVFISSFKGLRYLGLGGFGFHGTVPPHLGNLSSLQFLNLGGNSLLTVDNLEWLSRLSLLKFLSLSGIDLSKGTHLLNSINNLPFLTELYLSQCSLPCAFLLPPPFANSSSKSLSTLDLYNNSLTSSSSVYIWLFNFSASLVSIDLSYNKLQGPIPDAFGNMASLVNLYLSYNHFEGGIPRNLANLSRLRSLELSSNNLTGLFPDLVKNLSGKIERSLEVLGLGRNRLSGSLPDITRFSSLKKLYVEDNQLNEISASDDSVEKISRLECLDLSGNQIGSLPDFGNMASLVELDLSRNHIEGGIPRNFGNLSRLLWLELYRNNLTGLFPDLVKNLSGKIERSLMHLDLSGNRLSGSLPDITRFSSLKQLYVRDNQLNEISASDNSAGKISGLDYLDLSGNQIGSLPDLTMYSSLKLLYLSNNLMKGVLSKNIGQLSEIVKLDFSSNDLEGVISEAHLGNLSRLKSLDFSFNPLLDFEFDSSWVPRFQLDVVKLSNCKLGPGFPKWIRNQTSLSELNMSGAGISEPIPGWFWSQSSNLRVLDLSHNQIHGVLPDLSSKFADFPIVHLGDNNFTGPLPVFPPTITSLILSKNTFSGSISYMCHYNGSLSDLDLSDNLLSGTLPDCWNHFQRLIVLNLAKNNFSGNIPPSLGSLNQLLSLHLRQNHFTGELPLSLKNCTNLKIVDMGENNLSGNITSWIEEGPSELFVFSLRSNNFHGVIPPYICRLSQLQILDLSMNNISGSIPKCLNNLTAMSQVGVIGRNIDFTHEYFYYQGIASSIGAFYHDNMMLVWKRGEFEFQKFLGLMRVIDFSNNKLTGDIPFQITDLVGLVALNLSRNNLTGEIAPTIGQLRLLNFLDLSQNRLSGKIPNSITELSSLGVLDLSSNQLSGRIPVGTQLQSFNASSFVDNPGLCGEPLPKPCPGDEKMPRGGGGDDDGDGDDGFISTGFFVSLGLGFAFGFGGLVISFVLVDSWRYAWFKFVSDTSDWIYVTVVVSMRRLKRRLQS